MISNGAVGSDPTALELDKEYNIVSNQSSELTDDPDNFFRDYIKLLDFNILGRWKEVSINRSILCHALLPLLQMDTLSLRAICRRADLLHSDIVSRAYTRYPEPAPEGDLLRQRRVLQQAAETSEKNVDHFQRFVDTNQIYVEDRSYTSTKTDCYKVLAEAHRLEAAVRDTLQQESSDLALEESKRSIEISNLQIEEAQKGNHSLRY